MSNSLLRHYIESVTLPGVGEVPIEGLIVVVGPNSSGKTQFLTDLAIRPRDSSGKSVPNIVCTDIAYRRPVSLDELLLALQERHVLTLPVQSGSTVEITTSQIGRKKNIESSQTISTIAGWVNAWESKAVHFVHYFSPLLCTYLFLYNRLELIAEASAYDHQKAIPVNEVQELHRNDAGQDELSAEISRAFGRGVGIDSTRTKLSLVISDSPSNKALHVRAGDLPSLTRIELEGDGLRSYMAICLAMLASYRPLCLIDEPESCLHPPQAYALGQFIGRHGVDNRRTTVVATHSSHVLRGAVTATRDISIIRLTRHNRQFLAHRVSPEVLRDAIDKPTIRADEVFDGVFADGVVLVEAHGDRLVYQSAYEQRNVQKHFDVQFIAVGGIGGLTSACHFFKALHIPIAVVADLDLITQTQFVQVIDSLSSDTQCADSIKERATLLRNAVMQLPPTIAPDEAQRRLGEWTANALDWNSDRDKAFVRSLRELANDVDSMRKLKGGADAFEQHGEIIELIQSLVADCAQCGLWLVPVGELECWMPNAMAGMSRKRKPEWANKAVGVIRDTPADAADIIGFVSSIGDYLEGVRNSAFSSGAT